MRFTLKIFFAGLILSSLISLAGAQSFRFTNYTTIQGMSSNATRCVFNDSRGFLWIGTEDGLNLFDGHSFKVFRHNRFDSLSLPDNFINSIVEDDLGMLWIGTNSGITQLNPWSGRCQNIYHRESDSLSLPGNYGNRIFIDREKRIWICNAWGVCLYDPDRKAFHTLNHVAFHATSFAEENSNSFWIGSYQGLMHYIPSEKSWEKFLAYADDSKSNLINCVTIDHSGNIFCGIWGGGICRFDPNSKKFDRYRWSLHPENPSTVNIVMCIAETKDESDHHQLIVGTGEGLMIIDNDHFPSTLERIPRIKHDASNPESITGNFIFSIIEDSQHTIWIATGNGLSAILSSQQIFRVLDNGYRGQVMQMVRKDSLLYIASWYGNGLTICDTNLRVKKSFTRIPPNASSLDNGQISDIMIDENGTVWAATFNGLVKFNPANSQSEIFLHHETDSSSLSGNRITSLMEGNDHRIWVGTYHSGLNLFDPATKRSIHFHHQNDSTSITDDLIWLLRKDHTGKIWIGTNNGLCYYDETKNDFVNFQKEIQGIIHEIYEDTLGILWVATNRGLYELNAARDHTEFFSTEDGLASYDVGGIISDEDGNLWLVTSAGLTRFNPQTKFFTNYSIKNGLPDLPFQSVFYKNNKGIIYQGASNMFMYFDPKRLNTDSPAPPVYFTSLKINNAPLNTESISASPLKLTHDQNTIIIYYTAPEFNNPGDIHYLIKMDGADKEWRDEGSQSTVTYASLSPGDYVFHVKAQNADGVNSEKDAAIHFEIAPPFWKTWWFISVMVALLSAIFFFVVRYVSTRKLREQLLILEKEKAVEIERARISRDMHDDLGSGLTKIAIMSEVTQRQLGQPEKAKLQLSTISDSARILVDSLNEIIWTLNPQHDNLDSLMAYIRDYATRYFDGMDVSVMFDYPPSIPEVHLTDQQRRNIFLVVKESLNNISKHAQANHINIELKVQTNGFQISIRDEGKGFDVSNPRAGGNGLKNMAHRMKTVSGEYSIASEVGKGSITTIDMKIT